MESHPEEYYNSEHKQKSHNTILCLFGRKFLNLDILGFSLLDIDIGIFEPRTTYQIYYVREQMRCTGCIEAQAVAV